MKELGKKELGEKELAQKEICRQGKSGNGQRVGKIRDKHLKRAKENRSFRKTNALYRQVVCWDPCPSCAARSGKPPKTFPYSRGTTEANQITFSKSRSNRKRAKKRRLW